MEILKAFTPSIFSTAGQGFLAPIADKATKYLEKIVPGGSVVASLLTPVLQYTGESAIIYMLEKTIGRLFGWMLSPAVEYILYTEILVGSTYGIKTLVSKLLETKFALKIKDKILKLKVVQKLSEYLVKKPNVDKFIKRLTKSISYGLTMIFVRQFLKSKFMEGKLKWLTEKVKEYGAKIPWGDLFIRGNLFNFPDVVSTLWSSFSKLKQWWKTKNKDQEIKTIAENKISEPKVQEKLEKTIECDGKDIKDAVNKALEEKNNELNTLNNEKKKSLIYSNKRLRNMKLKTKKLQNSSKMKASH
jgi:hypothetical protein